MNRPALTVAIFYGLGILFGYYLNLPIYLLLVGTFLFLPLFVVFQLGRFPLAKQPANLCLVIGLVLTGFVRYELCTSNFPPNHISNYLHFEEPLTIRGRIVKDPDVREAKTMLTLEVTGVGWGEKSQAVVGRVLVKVKEPSERFAYGDVIELAGRIYEPSPARNPGAFDYRRYLSRQGVFGLVTVRRDDQVKIVERGGGNPFLSRIVLPIKRSIGATIDQNLSGAPAALLKGVMLGQRRALPQTVKEAFSNAGVIHVLAVSGLHVGLVVLIFLGFFRILRVPRNAAVMMAILVLVLYMFITDLRPSVVRASIMAMVVLGGMVLERNSNIFNTIAFAGLLILLFSPQALFDVSFQLSFAATLAIVYLYGPIKQMLPGPFRNQDVWWKRWLFGGLIVSLSAQLGATPIVAHYFHRLPIVSLLANLVVVPMVGVVIALGFAAAIFGVISSKFALIFNAANWLALTILLEMVKFFAHLPFASFKVASPSLAFLAGYFPLLVLAANLKRSVKARKALVLLALILTNLWVWYGALSSPGRQLVVTFLDVGQGDAAFIRFPKEGTMLIDGGPRWRDFDVGERVITPYLEHMGIKRIDKLVLTHPHIDHVGGLPAVLENFEVGEIIDGGQAHPSFTYRRFLELIDEKDIDYRIVQAGDRVEGFGNFYVLHPTDDFVTPEGEAPYNVNNGSVVLRLVYGRVSFLFLGDVELEAERALLCYGDWPQSTVIKVPHHGGLDSSSERLLKLVRPEIAVISVGRWNRFGHPSKAVIEQYQRLGATVYRTDLDGAVTVKTNGRDFWVETMR